MRPLGSKRVVFQNIQMHYNLASGAELDTTTVDLQFDDTAIGLRQVVVIDTDLAIPPNTADHVEQASTEMCATLFFALP
jgi:hypothetical protein